MESSGQRGWGCLPTLNQKCPKLEVPDAGNSVSLCAFVLCVYVHNFHSLLTFSVDLMHRSKAISVVCRGLKLGTQMHKCGSWFTACNTSICHGVIETHSVLCIKELVVCSALDQIRLLLPVDFAAFNDANTKRLYAFVPASIRWLFFVPLSSQNHSQE